MKNKVLVILGTRPEIIRLSCTIKKLNDNFDTIVVNTNQNFDKNLNKFFFKELNFIILFLIVTYISIKLGIKRHLHLVTLQNFKRNVEIVIFWARNSVRGRKYKIS